VADMFVETITTPRAEWERMNERLQVLSDPPETIVASITWDPGDGHVTTLNLWDSAEAIAEFYVERLHPLVAADGEPAFKPARHGEPIAVHLRR
jgi:hypothetical protein